MSVIGDITQNAIGQSRALAVPEQAAGNYTVQGVITGAPSAVAIDLEGTLDDMNYSSLASHAVTAGELAGGSFMFHVAGKPANKVLLNITTLTGGSSPVVASRIKVV